MTSGPEVEQQNLTLEQQKEQDFQKKYEAVFNEIKEVFGTKNDGSLEIKTEVIKSLDGAFGKILKSKNDQLKELKDAVSKIKNNPDLSVKAGSGLKALDQFLKDISDLERNKKDYTEFMERLKNPNSLNGLEEYEVRRLILHLSTNEGDAVDAYNRMKPIIGNFEKNGMKSTDIRYFKAVWKTLEDKYSQNEKFMENDYGELKSTGESIRKFVDKLIKDHEGGKISSVLSNWDGHSEIDKSWVVKKESIVSPDYVAKKFNEVNKQRVENNDKAVKNMRLDANELQGTFFYQNGNELYRYGDSTKMNPENILTGLSIAGLLMPDTSIEGADFVNSKDRQKTLEDCKGVLYDKVLNTLVQQDRNDRMQLNGKMKEGTVFDAVSNLADKNKFIEKDSEGNVSYLPDKAAAYLKSINEGEGVTRQYYKNLDPSDGHRQAWIAAVQVLLNNDPKLKDEIPLNVDGKFEQSKKDDDPTYERVKKFQDNHGFGKDDDKKGSGWQPDGLPGPNTISELIKNQENISSKEEEERADNVVMEFGLIKIDRSEFDGRTAFEYGISDSDIIHYKKEGDNDNVYYRQGNDIFKISKDKPWEISQVKLDDGGKVTWDSPKLHVCHNGAKKIEESLKTLDNSIFVNGVDGLNYKLTLGEGGSRININVGDSVYKAEGFCGKTEMVDRFKLVALAGKVKKEVGNESVKLEGFGIVKNDYNRDPNNTLINVNVFGDYGLDQSKVEEFITYCNSLKCDDNNKNYYIPLSG